MLECIIMIMSPAAPFKVLDFVTCINNDFLDHACVRV